MSDLTTSPAVINYINRLFKDYYTNHPVSNIVDISTREFGVGAFGQKISKRHLAFSNLKSFNDYLKTNTPFFVSYSVGYYKYPDRRPMENKQLTGADIVYEFDVDDFNLPCQDRHNVWVCKDPSCGDYGYGNKEFCETCKKPAKITQWTCDEGLDKVKSETIRLINFLESEFKLDPSTFIISFSGSKGYHVRITDKSIIPLSKSARLQLMNYIFAVSLDLEKLGFKTIGKKRFCPDINNSKGWSKKIIDYIYNLFSNSTAKDLENSLNISKKQAILLYDHKQTILKQMIHNNILWNDFRNSNKLWDKITSKAVDDLRLKIDPQSSSDIYKIMRVPDTIHGGTGFLSTSIKDIDSLKEFDAFSDPVVLRSEKIKKVKLLQITPKFRLLKEIYGPYEVNDIIEVPEHVAVFLVLKGVAKFE